MTKKAMAFILAVVWAMVSFPAALASEGGLFAKMIETEYADERLSRLDEIAETVSVPQNEGGITVEVSQAYYEGNRVYVSYTASAPIEEQDGLELEDGSYADIIAGGSVQQEDGSIIGWKECIVPEDELANTQTFCLVYRIAGSEEKRMLKFTLKQNAYDQYLQGDSPAAAYQARTILYMGKIDLKGIVVITSPEQAASWIAWQEGKESTGTDVIACWNLYQNGELVSADLFGESAVNGTDEVVFSVMYPYIDDLSGLTLVPEYSEAGEKMDEAIRLETASQE